MRHLLATSILLAIVFGAFALAHGDDAKPEEDEAQKAFEALSHRVQALEMEVRYLRSRERAVSAYVMRNEARGAGLQKVVAQSRRAGFEANRIPVDSRKILLLGLEQAAASIRKDLPAPTRAEMKALKELQAFRDAKGLDK